MATVAVWRIGDGVPEHVIMVSDTPITLHVNGAVSEVTGNARVTKLHGTSRQCTRLWVSKRQKARFDALRGAKWRDVIDAGLTAMEGRGNDR